MMTVGSFWRAQWISSLAFDLCQRRVSWSFKRQGAHLEANGLHSICLMGVRGQDSARGKSLTDWELKRSVPSAQALSREGVPGGFARTFGWGDSSFLSTTPHHHHHHMQVPLREPKLGPASVVGLCPKPEEISHLPLLSVGTLRRGREIKIGLHLSPNMHPRTTRKPQKKLASAGHGDSPVILALWRQRHDHCKCQTSLDVHGGRRIVQGQPGLCKNLPKTQPKSLISSENILSIKKDHPG